MKIDLYIVIDKYKKEKEHPNPIYLMGEWEATHEKSKKVEPYAVFNTKSEAQKVIKLSGKKRTEIKLATLIIQD